MMDRTINLTPQARVYLDYQVTIEDFNTVTGGDISCLHGIQIGKNHGEEGENSL